MTVRSYYSRKLHSLLGLVPIGLFLMEHLLSNAVALQGHSAFLQQVQRLQSLPFVPVIEIVFIGLPLLYHAGYGLYLSFISSYNIRAYPYARNLLFTMQRVTGLVVLVFIIWHVYTIRVQLALGHASYHELGVYMHQLVSRPLTMSLYVIAVLATIFHFCNGLWSFLISWGVTIGPKAQKRSGYACTVLFVLMSAVFMTTLAKFAGASFSVIPAG